MTPKSRAGAKNADVNELAEEWGAHIDPELLVLALTHRSFANEMGGLPNNERLEFLGDSVLSIIATESLYHAHPDVAESDLAKMRSAVVSQGPLATVARTLDLGSYVLLGVGEGRTGGRDKDSILSDTLEALIGATFLSVGIDGTKKVLLSHLQPVLEKAGDLSSTMDWKTPLRERALKLGIGEISYDVRGEGPDHNRHFYAQVIADKQVLGEGEGSSRRHAENDASRNVFLSMRSDSDITAEAGEEDA